MAIVGRLLPPAMQHMDVRREMIPNTLEADVQIGDGDAGNRLKTAAVSGSQQGCVTPEVVD